ncbi:MAG: hypothetical protein VKP72_05075 [bacterium]|nr:hypothetical protein [bacterium]
MNIAPERPALYRELLARTATTDLSAHVDAVLDRPRVRVSTIAPEEKASILKNLMKAFQAPSSEPRA